MKIIVMGAGAIGSLYGSLLSKAGEDVMLLVGRQEHVETINSRGLAVKGILGNHTLPLKAAVDPMDVDEADLVLLTTKTHDSLEAAMRVKHLIDGGAYLLIIQNGIGTEKIVAEQLNSRRVLRATTCMGAIMTSPGEVTITGTGITEVGSHFPENEEMVRKIVALLDRAGFDVRASDNIEGVVWTKTIVNCGINPIGALTGLTNGEIYNDPMLRKLVIHLVEEATEVAAAMGIELTTPDPVRYALGTAKATSENTNSMLQDINACKRTEIEAITGEVIRNGKALRIETPFSETVYALVKALEAKLLMLSGASSDMVPLSAEELHEAMPRS
ncbi:MAG: 2-dehydropantoate 2-reductase [Candidatus Thorarchaeota archaeon]|nr:2-dehydropantoate 2-reductase [Candidatus Thorarchaeota archaeon]